MKRSKLKKLPELRKTSTVDVEGIYKLKAQFVDSAYITIVPKSRSVFFRFTFTETKMGIGGNSPVTALMMDVDDVQNLYNHIGTQLQKLRELKVIP